MRRRRIVFLLLVFSVLPVFRENFARNGLIRAKSARGFARLHRGGDGLGKGVEEVCLLCDEVGDRADQVRCSVLA